MLTSHGLKEGQSFYTVFLTLYHRFYHLFLTDFRPSYETRDLSQDTAVNSGTERSLDDAVHSALWV